MQTLPQTFPHQRPVRVRLPQPIPAVLRAKDGACTKGELQVVSATGGLLSLPVPLHRSLQIKLLFVTSAGPVMGAAEMLDPITYTQQPFRLLKMDGGTVNRLQLAIKDALNPAGAEDEWVQRYRSAITNGETRRLPISRSLTIAVTLALLSLGGGAFLRLAK